MALNTDWKEFLKLLVSYDVEFMVVGAWARAQYGEPRMTGDIDFWIKVSRQNAQKVLHVIRDFGFASLEISEADLTAHDNVIQLGFPPRRIDILTHLTALEFDTAWQNRMLGHLDDIPVSFLSREDFILNKRSLGRPKDLDDVLAVSEKESSSDELG